MRDSHGRLSHGRELNIRQRSREDRHHGDRAHDASIDWAFALNGKGKDEQQDTKTGNRSDERQAAFSAHTEIPPVFGPIRPLLVARFLDMRSFIRKSVFKRIEAWYGSDLC